jgi:hypothetical protein
VAWLHTDNPVQELGENVILYDLSRIHGFSSILSRVPKNSGGVYAWYRHYEIPTNASTDPESFKSFILEELSKDHSAVRTGKIPPSHSVVLKPEMSFSKSTILESNATDLSFRQFILTLLENSMLFQQPFYIGKSYNLHSRIQSHLREGSILRERLKSAGHSIEKSRLLLVCNPNSNSFTETEEDSENEFSETSTDLLVEEILSRLFLPSFTLRYG